MFKRNFLTISLLVFGVMLSAGATALADNVRSLTLPNHVIVQGTHLQAGEYTITWYHHSPRLTVKVSNAKKVLVTAKATMIKWSRTEERDKIVVSTKADGVRVLHAIVFAGSNEAIVFDAPREKEAPFMPSFSSSSAGVRRPMAQ